MRRRSMAQAIVFEAAYYTSAVFLGLALGILVLGLSVYPSELRFQ